MTDEKLYPTEADVDSGTCLSFSTKPKLGTPSIQTTIEDVNSTKVLYAIKDGKYHVSVCPIGGTVEQWRNEGTNSIWSKSLKSVSVEWDGGFSR